MTSKKTIKYHVNFEKRIGELLKSKVVTDQFLDSMLRAMEDYFYSGDLLPKQKEVLVGNEMQYYFTLLLFDVDLDIDIFWTDDRNIITFQSIRARKAV